MVRQHELLLNRRNELERDICQLIRAIEQREVIEAAACTAGHDASELMHRLWSSARVLWPGKCVEKASGNCRQLGAQTDDRS